MPHTVGINHVTSPTADLDRLVEFYSRMFGAEKVFEAAAVGTEPRMAIIELGGTRYVKIVEELSGAAEVPATATERFGLAVDSVQALRSLRDRMLGAGSDVGEVERLPTQWVLRVTDPDGTPLQVCAHARPGDSR